MIKPIDDRILVEQHVKSEKSSTGIFIVNTMSEEAKDSLKLPQGTVVAVGIGESIAKNGMKVGDVVFFNEFAGDRVTFEEKEYVLLRMGEILAKQD